MISQHFDPLEAKRRDLSKKPRWYQTRDLCAPADSALYNGTSPNATATTPAISE